MGEDAISHHQKKMLRYMSCCKELGRNCSLCYHMIGNYMYYFFRGSQNTSQASAVPEAAHRDLLAHGAARAWLLCPDPPCSGHSAQSCLSSCTYFLFFLYEILVTKKDEELRALRQGQPS